MHWLPIGHTAAGFAVSCCAVQPVKLKAQRLPTSPKKSASSNLQQWDGQCSICGHVYGV